MKLRVAVVAALAVLATGAPAYAVPPEPVTKQDLLTLGEAAAVFPLLRGDDANQDRFRFGMDVPAYWTSPLRCDHHRSYKGDSRATASSYTLLGKDFGFQESIVRFRTKAQARSVLRHVRDYVERCGGRHATDDGEGRKATLTVRGWSPQPVGDETVGLIDGFTVSGRTQWRRYTAARSGRTVVLTLVEPHRGTGSAAQADAATRLAVEKLG